MLRYKGKEFQSFSYKGKNIIEFWCKGVKIWPEKETGPMIDFIITTTSANYAVDMSELMVADSGTSSIEIEWGDNSKNSYSLTTTAKALGTIKHTYSKAGTYTLRVKGDIKWLGTRFAPDGTGSSNTSFRTVLTAIELPTDTCAIKNTNPYAFYFCQRLNSVPSGLFKRCTSITDATGMFYLCQLSSIPADIFRYNTNVTLFNAVFYGTLLSTVPTDIFRYNTKVTSFTSAFMFSTISSPPGDLFRYNTNVTNFGSTFYQCAQLKTIPAGLFQYNTKATSFYNTFGECTALTAIPSTLFSKIPNSSSVSFSSTFSGCSSVTGALPTLWTTHSSAYTDGMTFSGCSKASNFLTAVNNRWATYSAAASLSVNIPENNYVLDLTDHIVLNDNDSKVSISWGDAEMDEVTLSNASVIQHTYTDQGDYKINLHGDFEWEENKYNDLSLRKVNAKTIILNSNDAE